MLDDKQTICSSSSISFVMVTYCR